MNNTRKYQIKNELNSIGINPLVQSKIKVSINLHPEKLKDGKQRLDFEKLRQIDDYQYQSKLGVQFRGTTERVINRT